MNEGHDAEWSIELNKTTDLPSDLTISLSTEATTSTV
jgi:hypothetical protein